MAITPTKLTRGVRNLHRLQQIARVLTQHGFGHIVSQLDLGRFVPLRLRRFASGGSKNGEQAAPESVGRRLKQVANDLGPVFIKLGQMLASRPDVLPPEILSELRTLQDQTDRFDSAVAKQLIADELKRPLSSAYASFEDEPIACGSIGQVHRATLADGREVVVKVQRPNIESVVRSDLALLNWLADALERWVPETAAYHPTILAAEFEQSLLRELDFANEAATTARLREAFRSDEQVEIPEVIWSHSTEKILTLEAIGGESIDQVLANNGDRLHRKETAERLVNLYLKQFFEIGVFHADPHPGNILVTAPARIGLIDFGQVGVVSDELAGQLLVLLFASVKRDVELLVDVLIEMGVAGPRIDRRLLARDLQLLLDKYHGQPLGRLNFMTLSSEFAETIRRHGMSIPRDVVMMLKAMTTVSGVALRLDPELNIAALLRTHVNRLVRDRLSPQRMLRVAGVTLWHFLGALRTAPQQLREVLKQVATGQWQLNIRHENLGPLGRDIDRSSNRLAFSIVIGAIVVGSSVVISSDTQRTVLGIPLQSFGVFGYLFAGLLGLGLLWAIFRSGRMS